MIRRYPRRVLIQRGKYILLEVPSNVILKRISPSLWLSCIMVLWGGLLNLLVSMEYLLTLVGIATIGQGLVRSFEGLVAMRVLVGIFEAGLFP